MRNNWINCMQYMDTSNLSALWDLLQMNGDKPRSVPRNTRAPSVTDLVFHDVDSTVRPIVANKRIERLPAPQFDQNAIPFEVKSPSVLHESDQVKLSPLYICSEDSRVSLQ